ncbi:hypothetical protein JL777_04790 [Staphylococcus pseudintermedius]|uniref:hypothetical protein n=1 Tax=Staphylococcus pseudintermedius TaxID=283734 RepID=UPI001655E736|nr:hypothetical protein [Staphylococcus pseudintermedius]EGQ2827398.1 hypothetical protein [Staphylococcus pseudintermedius]EGQ3902171.1 hypothetical protein [Staphylococcus pseudintermedius]EGQ4010679.1 hypothetical protein [Staphylococcus pseudintermedius]EIB5076588.1 hypothetical protein [Staphylococcus pseudintermedius]EIO0117183.1 hypothetical protein [Staphylococcus pseudintermedius]
MKLKRFLIFLMLAASISISTPATVDATVKSPTFHGVKIHWEYGRTFFTYSYSIVQTGRFTHSATANSTFSGWKRPGVKAVAKQYVGWRLAVAYWNCR